MNRRGFLSTSLGLLATTCMPPRALCGPSKPSLQWSAFCGYQSLQYDFSQPWVKAGVKYATDDNLAIAVRTDEPDTLRAPSADSQLAPAENLAWPTNQDADWRPWPRTPQLYAYDHVNRCGRERYEECPDCGEGFGCEKCDWEGVVNRRPCWMCGGSGLHSFAIIAGRHLGNAVIRTISELLPGPLEYVHEGEAEDTLKFRFAGGVGLVNPIPETDRYAPLNVQQTTDCRRFRIEV